MTASLPLAMACLEQLASRETETERLKRWEREIGNRIAAFSASDRLSWEHLYRR